MTTTSIKTTWECGRISMASRRRCQHPSRFQSLRPQYLPLGSVSQRLVRDAFAGIALTRERIELDVACRLLRSPFIGGGMGEAFPRARLEARLRACGEMAIGLEFLRRRAMHELRPGQHAGDGVDLGLIEHGSPEGDLSVAHGQIR